MLDVRLTLCIAALLVLAGAAGAAEGDPYLKSCYSTSPAAPCVGLAPAFQGGDLALSPDGRQLYAAVWKVDPGGWTGIRLFDVGAHGAITPRAGSEGCYADAVAGCTDLSAEFAGTDVDLSPDGRNLYLTGNGSLVVFARDTTTGALSQAQCWGAPPCLPSTTFGPLMSAAVSPDGANLYVRSANQLTVWDRNPADGTLILKTCLSEELPLTCTNVSGIAGTGYETSVSPDGRQVYASNEIPGGVAAFNRAPDGTLTSIGCVTTNGSSGSSGGSSECAGGPPTLAQAKAVNLDAQGQFLFASSETGQTVFRRNADGSLSETDCLDEAGGVPPPAGCHEVNGAAGYGAAATGSDVALNAMNVGLSFFTLDRGSGKLTQRASQGCVTDVGPGAPCEYAPGLLHGPGGVALAADGLDVFAVLRTLTGSGGSASSYDRDVAPGCLNRTATVQRDKSIAVPLTCTDPNGDTITLEVTAPPSAGTLGPIDQTNDRVLYRPDPGYRGRDSFKYRGKARGVPSGAAIVSLTIAGKPTAVDRKPPNTRITSGPPKKTKSGKARFKFRSTERGSFFQCRLDRRPWTGCRSPKRFKDLKLGKHTFRARAIDRAGNVDRSPAKRIWTRKR
jgi:Big-like domain-containing protein